ncbi:type II toxin-antitoxin system RelB/DinJ family antitoxin [Enterococcus sp. 669A]|uniref:Type II toxin-antitoxin system RelB/DinJ family antitoxin n=1 Tax=Candidatus Enterococcus moelleringii TaxID=2815325 RepID=A0ABS3LBC2_9ENTE|nr:type II toxin-antitoxin system RelB/DinJ family antitoxin [Enterococcus sp. 669A]MBO1306921.1 type II toxin-antitoxin system RelB/DinJ family antitoxin [Enterococcus sp. 669A]
MTTSAAVEIFLAKFVESGKFPFQIEVMDYQPNDETKKSFEETEEMRKTSDLMNDEDLTSYFERMKNEAAEEVVK